MRRLFIKATSLSVSDFAVLAFLFCSIKEHAAAVVSDEAFERRAKRWPESTPDTKEAYFIHDIFDGLSRLPTPLFLANSAAHLTRFRAGLFPPAAAATVVRCVLIGVIVRAKSRLMLCGIAAGGYPVATGAARQTRAAGASAYTTRHTARRRRARARASSVRA